MTYTLYIGSCNKAQAESTTIPTVDRKEGSHTLVDMGDKFFYVPPETPFRIEYEE